MGLTLRDWRAKTGRTQEWVADQLQVDQATVSRAETSGRTRDLRLALAIQTLTGGDVPVEIWNTGPATEPATTVGVSAPDPDDGKEAGAA